MIKTYWFLGCAKPMMSEIQLFGYSASIGYAWALLSLAVGGVMLLTFWIIQPAHNAEGRGSNPAVLGLGEGKIGNARKAALTPYAQGEADALAGRPCLYETPISDRLPSERLYYSGYHDTLNRIRREAQEAEGLR